METILAQQALPPSVPAGTAAAPDAVARVEAGYGTNLSSGAAGFADSLARAEAGGELSPVGKAVLEPLERINTEAQALADYAEQAIASGNELTPAEIVTLTVRSQEFMFHSQLTSNMANRTADGLQQLFRQQG